jgi:hypothetical protein
MASRRSVLILSPAFFGISVNGTFKLTHVTADRHFETDPPDLAV